ncbi:LppM family (lipo)protein [Jiangella gansuensis]|uniref:LppM family (lipo)protein n=1 Tax=Jiangella gansuensis TaxID=281473 RepID=UPI0012F7B627|nr:hypothetical protein [Jiangella gansuensis]
MRRATPVRALAVAVMAAALTGCLKVDMELDVNTDDTVDGEMVFAVSRDVMAMAESMGEDPDALLDELEQQGGLPDDTEVEEYEDDDYVGQRFVFDGVALSEFSQDEGGFEIVHEGDEFVVSGTMDMSDMDMGGMTGEDLEGLEDELGGDLGDLGDLEGMMESFDLQLSITFPGEVREHNGELDGTTVTWTPVPGENVEIMARSADSGGAGGDGLPVWLWILIVVVVVALAALLFFLARNRNKAAPGEPGASAGPAAAGAVPPPPPGPSNEPPAPGSVPPAPGSVPPAPPR